MAPNAKNIVDDAMNGQKSLGLPRRLISTHLPLSLPSRLGGKLSPVVRVLVGIMAYRWNNNPVCGTIASQLVSYNLTRCSTLPFQQVTKETSGSRPISAGLDQNIDNLPVLIDGTPKVVAFTANGDKNLIHIPRISQATAAPFQCTGIGWTEFGAPLSDCFVRNRDTPFRQQIFGITEAETEAVVPPDGMTDDFWWKPVASVTVFDAKCLSI
jgi:hypothetical protein